jgi:hypothetical protein
VEINEIAPGTDGDDIAETIRDSIAGSRRRPIGMGEGEAAKKAPPGSLKRRGRKKANGRNEQPSQPWKHTRAEACHHLC